MTNKLAVVFLYSLASSVKDPTRTRQNAFRRPCPCLPPEQTKSNLKVTSPEDSEHLSRRQLSPNGTAPPKGDAKGSRTVPRRHTLGGARGSREILAMQPPDMDKKREAFLEHLKQKYPHHASAIMGHQERLREQVSRTLTLTLGGSGDGILDVYILRLYMQIH